MGSSGGGSARTPSQATPGGMISGYGSSTPFSPSYSSVLSNGMGWADVGEIDAANDRNFSAAAAAPPPPAAAAANPLTDANAFAQKLLDYQKQQQMGRFMMGMGPQGMAAGLPMWRAQAPVASNPMEQLMAQALQQRQGGSGMAGNGRSMASYRR